MNSTCSHTINSGSLYKATIKNEIGESIRMSECSLCLIWGVWEKYAQTYLQNFAEPSQISSIKLNNACLDAAGEIAPTVDEGLFKMLRHLFLPHMSVPLMPVPLMPDASESPEKKKSKKEFLVHLEPGQFGKAYHVLICQFLLKEVEDIKIHVGIKKGDQTTSEIRDLFSWYRIPLLKDEDASKKHKATSVSKKQATEIIAAAFRASNDESEISKRLKGRKLGHHALFDHIRDSLNPLEPHLQKNPGNHRSFFTWILPSSHSLPQSPSFIPSSRYFQPSYTAKYWLNRYFRLTGQFDTSTPQTDRKSGMIKPGLDRKLAVIHIRRHAASNVGRLMDDQNLKHVVHSISEANKLCRMSSNRVFRSSNSESGNPESGSHYATMAFSHVILYGDFDYREGQKLRKLVEGWLAEDMHVSFISHPWKAASRKETSTKDDPIERKVDQLWAQFRDFNVDRLPTQVKILGIWTALRERYGDNICVIGHRSGFVESAGLLGIPIFYLNNERDDIGLNKEGLAEGDLSRGKLVQGELLWNALAVQRPDNDRLRELADVMNTFIPVEALDGTPKKIKRGPDVFRVRKDFEKELTAAVFIYMCCLLDPWAPAWTARVKMMHTGTENETAKYSAAGQGWLRERCDYAFKKANLSKSRTSQ